MINTIMMNQNKWESEAEDGQNGHLEQLSEVTSMRK